MKVLAVAEFDAAGVGVFHQRYLQNAGVDYRLAVQTVYAHQPAGDDVWWWDGRDDRAELAAFAAECDVLQVHPAIGQPWSYSDLTPRVMADGIYQSFCGLDVQALAARVPTVALFHGSRNAWANRHTYADTYRRAGVSLWATTADYVGEMGATYAPPIIHDMTPLAALREPGEPLRVVHAPTDPANCHTEQFLALAQMVADCVPQYFHRQPHGDVLAAKSRAHAGFDHLRGAFSVNTLENACAGLVCLCGMRPDYAAALLEQDYTPPPMPPIESPDDLALWLRRLAADADLCADYQRRARIWFVNHRDPELLARRLADQYRGLL